MVMCNWEEHRHSESDKEVKVKIKDLYREAGLESAHLLQAISLVQKFGFFF